MNEAEQPRLIAETVLTEIFHLRGTSPYCIITFSEHGMRANGKHFWGLSMFQDFGIEAIGVVARYPHWFPRSDFNQYSEVIRETFARSGKTRVGYGHSMGAYGAIKNAAALQLDVVIAYSPHCSIAPQDIETMRSDWSADYDAVLNEGMLVTSDDVGDNSRVYAFFDPLDQLEALHIQRIQDVVKKFHRVPVWYVGHPLVSAIAGAGEFQQIITTVLEHPVDANVKLQKLCNIKKKTSDVYIWGLANELHRRGHFKWFVRVVQTGIARQPQSLGLLLLGIRVAELSNDADMLDEYMARAISINPDSPDVYAWGGMVARSLGSPIKAAGWLRTAYAIRPAWTHLEKIIAELSNS